jgi:phosphatidylserine/phosphatidylglycerophosphate/cardiolipin synthase-like enzyme
LRERVILKPGNRRAAVQEVIDTARNSLVLSIYRLDDADVLAALTRAVRRGVAVNVLVTQRVKGSKAALDVLVAALKGAGFGVRRYAHLPKYHAKYIVADDRLALVGSLNFTQKCFDDTCDFAVLTRDREVIGGLARLFQLDYDGKWSTGDFGSRLIVGPDNARIRYAALLAQARRSLRLIDHKLTDAEMLSVIRSRAGAGVSVELLGRDDVEPLSPHGKLVIVDSEMAAIGSMSLSWRSLDRRRELAIVLRDRASIAVLHEYFEEFRPRMLYEAV